MDALLFGASLQKVDSVESRFRLCVSKASAASVIGMCMDLIKRHLGVYGRSLLHIIMFLSSAKARQLPVDISWRSQTRTSGSSTRAEGELPI